MKTVILESGIPVPQLRQWGKWATAIGHMKIGQSFTAEGYNGKQAALMACRRLGFKPRSRKVNGKYRIWRVA